ncbi:hypothetical protein [Glaciecola sp. MH2013]|uniref:hypothetical protein n=1 Tax=Glaciecola sp. MH2013 TaxID=2785524 RepID=UPI00189F3ECA|nr:hypothetical protein [Glaciecola sp. MH2013]
MHPFLDGSGVVFFDPAKTTISSLNISLDAFNVWLDAPDELREDDRMRFDTLVRQGFLVKNTSVNSKAGDP